MSDGKIGPFDAQTDAIPIGHYVGGVDAPAESSKTLVGRARALEQVEELLRNGGKTGAILVTGHRGSGKTSFIRHCIEKYRTDAWYRFLNGETGRRLLWDQILLLVLGGLLTGAGLVLYELNSLAVEWAAEGSAAGPWPSPRWFVVVPLALLALSPMLYAQRLIETLLHRTRPGAARYGAFVAIVAFGLLSWFCLPTGGPAGSVLLMAGLLLVGVVLGQLAHRLEGACSQARPRAVALVKAACTVIFALQLSHPVLSYLQHQVVEVVRPSGGWAVEAGDPFVDDPLSRGSVAEVRAPRPLAMIPGADSDQGGPGFSTQRTRHDEAYWMMGLLVIGTLFFLAEYAWIVRPRSGSGRESGEGDRYDEELAGLTFPAWVFDTWHPVIEIRINLGFDKLEHGRVIEAMLACLRARYYDEFLSWRSGFANSRRLVLGIILLAISFQLGDRLFHMPQSGRHAAVGGNLCWEFESPSSLSPALSQICAWTEQDTGNAIAQALYLPILSPVPSPTQSPQWDPPSWRADHLVCLVMPCSGEEGKYLYAYHLLTLAVVALIARALGRGLWFAPFSTRLREIDELLDQLSSRRTTRTSADVFSPVRLLQGLVNRATDEERAIDPTDSRVIEARLLDILSSIQRPHAELASTLGLSVALPSPDLIFVFDELDKLGLRADAPDPGGREGASLAQRRSEALHRLLADMKNLLSTAPARFFFVGGRDLHDEWLADQTDRRPLLTNIFQAEVYLPSLVMDDYDQNWTNTIKDYLDAQIHAGKLMFDSLQVARNQALFPLLPVERRQAPAFSTRAPPRQGSTTGWRGLQSESDFVQFLTFRSIGNPKRLKELLESFIFPVGPADGFTGQANHKLLFDESNRYRIQFVAETFRQLDVRFGQQSTLRDDKLPLALFYLSDFLFKFHGRAFSWSNLERVDELVHIHRAHDHRAVLEELVVCWSERYLQPIRNGMYDFRFRSSVAAEIEYLSRQSEQEMAALNFTLDEARALKALYRHQIDEMGEGATHDAYAGLAELYEFDQEFEQARYAYSRALQILDYRFNQAMSRHVEEPATYVALQVDDGASTAGQRILRADLVWGVARLRIMLQVGMTFELANNLERALAEYSNARSFAWLLIRTMLNEADKENRIHALKHLNILFQPIFAEAWIAEKLPLGVDTSLSLVRGNLEALEREFAKVMAGGTRHRNLMLTLAELNNKAGDLCFYKGTQVEGRVGYLAEATWYYAWGLSRLLRYARRRPGSVHGDFSDYMYRLLGGSLTDLADALLAQAKIEKKDFSNACTYKWDDIKRHKVLVASMAAGGAGATWEAATMGQLAIFLEKLDRDDRVWARSADLTGEGASDDARSLQLRWATDLVEVVRAEQGGQTGCGLIARSVALSLAGADMMAKAGHIEDSARHFEQVIELLGELAWWYRQHQNGTYGVTGLGDKIPSWMKDAGDDAVKSARQWYKRARTMRHDTSSGAGAAPTDDEVLPVSMVVATCSLALALDDYSQLLKFVPTVKLGDVHAQRAAAQKLLVDRFHKSPYPTLTRLNALRAWIESRSQDLVASIRTGDTSGSGIGTDITHTDASLRAAVRELVKELRERRDRESHELQKLSKLSEDVQSPLCAKCKSRYELKIRLLDVHVERFSALDGENSPLTEGSIRQYGGRLSACQQQLKGYFEAEDLVNLTEFASAVYRLLDLESQFDSPLHFTNLQMGHTLATACLTLELFGWVDQRIKSEAIRHLALSEEIVTMRRHYYDTVASLNYIYDDFNDRLLHMRHAIQMAGINLTSALRVGLESR